MENAKKFFEEALKTEEARRLLAGCKQPKTPEDSLRTYSKVAKEMGIDLSEEEITAYFEEKLARCTASAELDDDELAMFTGGTASECSASYLDRENCWWNDGCDYYTNTYSAYRCSWSYQGACAAFYVDDETEKSSSNPNPQPHKFA